MKILFYINVLSGGGAERVIANLSNQFATDNNEVLLVTTYSTPNEYSIIDKVNRINLENREVKYKNRFTQNIKRIKLLRSIIKRYKPDAVVSFMEEPNFRNIVATAGLPVKTIVSVRNDPKKEYYGRIGDFIAFFLMPFADGCVFQTEDACNYFPKRLRKKSAIIFNSVKEDFYNIKRKPLEGKIVNIGRISKQKNQKLLIEAFYEVVTNFPNAKLEIYGEGPLNNDIIQLIKNYSLVDSVSLKGNVNNIPQVLAETDIFVLSSDFEGMPNALMEAMAMGIPCISTDCPCGGPRMLLENGKNGILVPVGDVKELSKALDLLLSNVKMKKYLGKNAKEKANKFMPNEIYYEWKSYIQKVVQS